MARPERAPFLFPAEARLGVHNVILHAQAKRHRVDQYAGPLSIKTVVSGRVAWVVGQRELVVDQGSFLVIADGVRYSMNIDELKPVETCCAFFAPGYVERIALDVTSPVEQALDQPDRAAPPLPYLSALHGDREQLLVSRVRSLSRRCRDGIGPTAAEEDFLTLADHLLQFYEQVREQIARLPAVRESTRQELFRRLLVGRDYMHACVSEPLSLESVARTACLSPFHFHRAFRQAFQQTPHTYLTRLRLERARALIESGTPILTACVELGFTSQSAFSRLFRAHYGERPSAVRPRFARLGKSAAAASARLGT